jgi:hypothetical protein
VDSSEEISGSFVVTRSDGSELFEFTEEILDEVSRFIEFSVKIGRRQAIRPGRDHRRFAGGGQRFADPRVGIKGLVGDQRIGGHLRQQRIGSDQIVRLPGGQQKSQRVAERVDQGMDFRAQPAATVAERLVVIFFWERQRCADVRGR